MEAKIFFAICLLCAIAGSYAQVSDDGQESLVRVRRGDNNNLRFPKPESAYPKPDRSDEPVYGTIAGEARQNPSRRPRPQAIQPNDPRFPPVVNNPKPSTSGSGTKPAAVPKPTTATHRPVPKPPTSATARKPAVVPKPTTATHRPVPKPSTSATGRKPAVAPKPKKN